MIKTLTGIPASSGVAKGVAKVILTELQFSEFTPEDILVTKQTSPAWTPLFAAAKGVITELGGQLSHAAIVSREYGIPAVVGVKNATSEIKSGQTVVINGSEGKVEIV